MLYGMPTRSLPRRYDHRLVALVRETGDPTVATRPPFDARVVSCRASEKIVARELLDGLGAEDLLLLDAGLRGAAWSG